MDHLRFTFSNDYGIDDAETTTENGSNKKEETKIKNEPEEMADDDADDDSYLMPESLLQQTTIIPGDTDDGGGDGEDDNTIFNFGIEPNPAVVQTKHLPPTPIMPKTSGNKSAPDAFVNYDLAITYICPACGIEFDKQTTWKSHINTVHEYNTRRGLNFVPIDKLYHRCLECNKPIAMHAMENLLKHKFTHLPHRCTKCRICHRLYKYRQDLIIHLRLIHRSEVLTLMESVNNELFNVNIPNSHPKTPTTTPSLSIRDIKSNAIDIYENTCDSVEVRNEAMDQDEQDNENLLEPKSNKSKSILEDVLSRNSSRNAEQQQQLENGKEKKCRKYIQYNCPVCSIEFGNKNDWMEHAQEMHNFGSINGLGFRMGLNNNVECMECNRVMADKSIEQLQLHKFSHLPCKTWLRCKICSRSFSNQREIISHIINQHRFHTDGGNNEAANNSHDPFSMSSSSNNYSTTAADETDLNDAIKHEVRDIYESRIDYLCPKCGDEFLERKYWRKHIQEHQYNDLQTLCFVVLNEHQLQCRLCGKIITNAYGVQNAQQHYFTHLPHKAYIRCRLCRKAYTDRKGLVKHLRKVHHVNRLAMNVAASAMIGKKADKRPRSRSQSPLPSSHTTYQQNMSTNEPKPKMPCATTPLKEIVRHNGVTYEIKFLEEDENDDDGALMDDTSNMSNTSNSYARNDDSYTLPVNRHVCPDCYSTFSTLQGLQRHTREQHDFKKPTQTYVCTLCYCTFESSGALQDHKQKHHPKTSELLNKIDDNDNDKDDNDDDLLLVPSGAEEEVKPSTGNAGTVNIEQYFCYMCPACGVEFKSQYEWRRHINEIHYFDRRYELNFRQIDKFHFQCLECKDVVNSAKLKGLQDHKFRHLPYKLYIKCRLCSTCYNHKPNMLTHLRIRHNLVDPREERNCSPPISPLPPIRTNSSGNQNTTNSSSINTPYQYYNDYNKPANVETNHNAVDHESITYHCPQCNNPFDTHAAWRQHIVTAHDLNSRRGLNFRQLDAHHYICLECYKRVTVTHTKGAIGQLQSHKFRHLPYKSFTCTSCYQLFVRKQMFFKHLNRATNRCPLLGNERVPNYNAAANVKGKITGSGGTQMSLARPNNIEPTIIKPANPLNFSITSNEKCPYIIQCPQCGIKFEKWTPWRYHIEKVHALHTMESFNFTKINDHLHICRQCKERVTGANFINLQTHRFKHLPYGTYLHCRFCDVRYYYMINIIKHMKQKHPNHGLEQLQLQLQQSTEEYADSTPIASIDLDADNDEEEEEGPPHADVDLCKEDNNKDTDNDSSQAPADNNEADVVKENIISDQNKSAALPKSNETENASGKSSSTETITKSTYTIQCPQCGIKYDNWDGWRQHIAAEHSLNKHEMLNFTKINDRLQECNECKERLTDTSLFKLQTHKFKHLPYGTYLLCRHCDEKFYYTVHIIRHMKLQHPEQSVVQQQETSSNSGMSEALAAVITEMNKKEQEAQVAHEVTKDDDDVDPLKAAIGVDAVAGVDDDEDDDDDDDDDDDLEEGLVDDVGDINDVVNEVDDDDDDDDNDEDDDDDVGLDDDDEDIDNDDVGEIVMPPVEVAIDVAKNVEAFKPVDHVVDDENDDDDDDGVDDDDVDDDDDDDDDDIDDDADDDEIEAYGNETAIDSENTNMEGSQGTVAEPDEQFVLG